MKHPRRATGSLSRKDALRELETMAQALKALGLTRPPERLCAGLRKYGRGWAVYIGQQDSDDLG